MTPKKPSKRLIAARSALVAVIALTAVPAMAITGKAHVANGLGAAATELPLSDLIELKARVENGKHLSPQRHLEIIRLQRGF